MDFEIEYINLGRKQFSGLIKHKIDTEGYTSQIIAELAYYDAKKHCVSREIETAYDIDSNNGTVLAGSRIAGHFKVIN